MNEAVRVPSAAHVDGRLRATLGEVDHRKVLAPYLRLISCTEGAAGDRVFHWDVRVAQPNREHVDMPAVHSLEHALAVSLRRRVPGFINFGPMGCQTGFYLTVLNNGSYDAMLDALAQALADCLAANEVPLANDVDCGWAANHSLDGAKRIARRMLDAKDEWTTVTAP